MTSVSEEIAEQRRLVEKKRIRYSFDFSLHYHQVINTLLLEQLASDPSLAVLDCGCGTGEVLICRKLVENTLLTTLAAFLAARRSHWFCVLTSI